MAEPPKLEPRKYQIVRQIGKGGMGTVYEVTHKRFANWRRAVKVLNPELAGRKDLLDRFLKEAVRMAQFQHAHIVKVHDIEEEEGCTYIVMDLIEGRSLREILVANGPLPYLEVLRIGWEITSALDVAHRESIIHRDIKAQNILIESATGKAVLTDFGIAKELHREGEETIDGTTPGIFVGTIRYACPEQLLMGRAHPRWDIYAMGAVLYEALSGHTYLEDIARDEIPRRIVDPNFLPRLEYPQPPAEDFDRLIRDCVHRDADQRIPSAAELLRRLESCREAYLALHAEQQTQEARQSLRAEIQRKMRELESLQDQLGEVGASAGDGTRAPELAGALREVDELEEAGRYREALARLEALSERAARAERRGGHIARDEFQRSIDSLAKRWDGLHRHATPWLPSADSARVEELLARLRRSLENGEWGAVAQDINDAPSLIARLETTARAAAEAAAHAALAAIEAAIVEVRRLDASAVPRSVDVEALRARVVARMQEQQFDAAVQEAESVRASVDAVLQGARERAVEHLQAARAGAERARAALDLQAARAVAAEELGAAEQAFAAAAAGEADPAAAAVQYARAAEAYGTVASRVSARQEEERAAVADELRAALAAAAGEPDVVVGPARRAAEAALARPAAPPEATVSLRAALAALAAARNELLAFREADAARVAAEAAQQRAGTAAAPRAELRAAAGMVGDAARLFESRRWDAARERYDEAAAEWAAIEKRAAALAEEERRRMLEARCAALRDELDAGVRTLEQLMRCATALAVRVDAPTADDIRRAGAEGNELERAGALEPALERLGGARERLAVGETAYRGALAAALERATAELTARWGDMAERAATLVTPALRQQFEGHAAAPGAAAARGEWDRACETLDAARTWLDGCETDLRATAKRALGKPLTALAGAVESLRNRGDEPPAGVDPERVRAEVEAALAAGQFAAAADRVDAARRQVDAALEDQRQRLAASMAAARARLEQVLQGFDLDAARAAAEQSVDAGSRARKEAASAERREDWRAAADAYDRAAASFRAAAEQLAADRRRQIAAAVAALRNLLTRAVSEPPELVGDAARLARTALEEVDGPDAVATLASLERARAALAAALGDAAAFAAAQQNQQAAEDAAHRLDDLPLTAQEREAAATALRPATQALERRAWSDAQAKYSQARRQLEQLAHTVTTRRGQEKLLAEQREAARAELRAAIERAGGKPDEVVGAARRAADELLAVAAPAPEELGAARAALLAAIDETPRYQEAAQHRAAVREAADRTVLVPHGRRTLKRAAKLLRNADAAMVARQWDEAADGYRAALGEYEAAPKVTSPTRWRAIAGAAAAALIVALAWWGTGQWRSQPAPPRARIASASPSAEEVTIKADAAQTFSIELPSGVQANDIEWVLAGKPVQGARGKSTWRYTPDAGDVRKSPYDLAVKVDGGGAPEQTRSWKVYVAPVEVANVPPPIETINPVPPKAAVASIAAAEPSEADVTVAEGTAQRFAVQLADAGGGTPDIEWLFDNKVVSDARGHTSWQYTPDFAAAGGPRPVTVRVGSGADAPAHTWNVSVTDVNRPPVVKSDPPAGKPVTAEKGSTKTFTVTAKDADSDPLTYAWTVDGKPAGGNQPTLDVQVAGDQRVALAVTDGKMADPIHLDWPLNASAPTLEMTAQPPSLKALAYMHPQQFKLVPAAGAPAPIQIAWAVDGKKVSDGPSFVFTPDDAALVRSTPVRIDATARAANGGEFTYNWKFPVQPPPPRIEDATPSDTSITAESSKEQRFTLDAAAPVGNQNLTYVFSVNGKETQTSTASYDLTVAPGKDYTVIASIRDNYGQRSPERKWTIRGERQPPDRGEQQPPGDVLKSVQAWLDAYRSALVNKDTSNACSLLALSSDKCAVLGNALKSQEDLEVAFNNVKIAASGADTACATYTRRDSFVDPAGKHQERQTPVNQCFRVVGGKVQLQRGN